MEDHRTLSIFSQILKGWRKYVCGTLILPVVGTSSLVLDGKKYGSYLFCLSLLVFLLFLTYAVVDLIREKIKRVNELEDLLVPKLSIVFEVTSKPYTENVKSVGSIECRHIRIGVKNNNLIKASNVCVQFESCFPSSKAILLKQALMPTGIIAPVSIGPRQEQLFDVVTEDVSTKDARIAYNMTGPDASIEKHEHEIVISARCDESVPTTATFIIKPGHDGFFVMRRILDQLTDSAELGDRRV